jgi:hypothetical protein
MNVQSLINIVLHRRKIDLILDLQAVGWLEDHPARCGLEHLPMVSTLELLALCIGLELRADAFNLGLGGIFFTGVAVTGMIAGAARDWGDWDWESVRPIMRLAVAASTLVSACDTAAIDRSFPFHAQDILICRDSAR